MRPVLLEMDGFGAFKQRTVIDFADTDFFALAGATGSGKSTIVDAICFALYGSVPRYGDERVVGQAMSAGHQETAVRFTFDAGGERYVAARVVRRDRAGKPSTKEARLETAGGRELAGRASEMATEVERVLGLPFAHFTRCVVLPQGDFARFLHDRPADRQALLVQLLDLGVYGEMARQANLRASVAAAAALFAAQQEEALAGATPEALDEARARLQRVGLLVAQLEDAVAAVADGDRAIVVAAAAATEAGAMVTALRGVTVAADARTAGAAVEAANAALAVAEADVASAAAAAEAARSARAGQPALDVLLVASDAHRQLDAARRQLLVAEEARAAAAAEVARAEAKRVAMADQLAQAESDHERGREAFAAHLLAGRLEVGGPCPVCGQTVDVAPDVAPPSDLQRVQAGLKRAQAEHAEAQSARGRAAVAHGQSEARLEQVAAGVAALEVKVADFPDASALASLVAQVEAAVAAERASFERERASAAVLATARAGLDAARHASGALSAGYFAQRDAVTALGPPPPGDDVVVAWEALAAWAVAIGPEHEERATRAVAAEEAAREARRALLAGLVDRAAAADVAAPADLGDLRIAAAEAQADARQALVAVERDVADGQRYRAERAAAQERGAVAQELGRLLSARGFERWLVAEALDRLAAGASATLHQLTSGQYSLAVGADGEFSVTDHANGDEVRPVRTLSGGETFQASLALALALADELSDLAVGGVAKLEAIFLDEGFGTLDPESLETVAATIEALGSGGRMVGIVTHVRELAARVPVRYEVRKTPITSVVERVVG